MGKFNPTNALSIYTIAQLLLRWLQGVAQWELIVTGRSTAIAL